MKICVIGDLHLRTELPYSSAIPDGRRSEWAAVLDKIVETANKCDAVVLLGDVLNSRNNASVVLKELVEFLKRLGDKPVHIISGNHERMGPNTALDFLQKINHKNWHVYTEITQGVQIGDIKATFIPFTTYAQLGVTIKEEGEKALIDSLNPADVSFSHHAFAGGKSTEFFNTEIVLDKDKMSKLFGMNFFGHIHKAERLGINVQGTGSIFTQEIGESEKSIFIWDSQTKTIEEIPLPVRQIHKMIWEEQSGKEIIASTAIVKCYVTNKETNVEDVKEALKYFDAAIVIEQYPSTREKVHFEEGTLDLSVDNLLKVYAETKGLNYADLKQAFEIIKI